MEMITAGELVKLKMTFLAGFLETFGNCVLVQIHPELFRVITPDIVFVLCQI